MTASVALIEAIDAQLPQTQCRKCGFQGCRPYAEALAAGTTGINRCPPGGSDGIARLAALLDRPALPLDPDCGVEAPLKLALIAEDACIGCTLCIQACPVDAIVGAPKRMHTVLLAHCTGCELCLPPCPVDCIEMIDAGTLAQRGAAGAHTRREMDPAETRASSRRRYLTHLTQVERLKARNDARLARNAQEKLAGLNGGDPDAARKRDTVLRALARARQRRATR